MDYLTEVVIKPNDWVLDVGCGHAPFWRANVGIDFLPIESLQLLWDGLKVKQRPAQIVRCDFSRCHLPFADKSFDFVFCRHTIEDMADPFFLMCEMNRVGKAGYIETPSPIAELVRGVDGFKNGNEWRGYHHHRQIVWVVGDQLQVVSKYPIVEALEFTEDALEDALRRGPELWNSYYLWTGAINWRHRRNPFDFNFAADYQPMLWQAALDSAKATDAFCKMVNSASKKAA